MTLVGARGAELELNGNHAIYRDALEHTDSVVLQGDGWVEQLLVFRDDQAPRRVAFDVTSGGPIREVVEENGALRFVDGAGATSLSMARPFAVDADGQRLELDVQWSEGRLELALRDVSARYPVVLDPAIEVVGWTRIPIFEHRFGAAMATLNGTIVLFGGVDQQSQDLDDTWTFDGALWTHRQLSVSPPGRSGHAMAAVNGKVILFGGSRNRVDLGDTWEWDGARWTEKRVAISPPPRSQHAMAAAGTDLVLFGGSVPTSDTWLWNGSTWTEQHPISSPAARFGHVMASTGSSVVLGGGRTGFSVTNQDTWIWNSGTWTRDIRPSQVFFSESMLVDGPGSVTLISRGGSGPAPWVSSIFRWEPANGWSLVNGSSAAYFSQSGSAAQLGANTVVVSGTANPTWIWDGGTWAPSPATAAAPYPQRWTSMAALDGSVIVFGDGVSESWLWNGERWALGPVSPAPPGRTLHALTEFGGRVVLYGGSATGIGQLDDTWELDELGWHQRSPTASPPARIGHSMSATAGHVVVFGGEVGSVLSDETWLWDGGAWARVIPAISPPPRLSSAMAPVDGGVLLFGGEGALGFLLNDTWFWNGASWSELMPATQPPPRDGHRMASLDGKVILFGGAAERPGVPPEGTWIWDGVNWSAFPGPSPFARDDFGMATLGDRIVMAWGLGRGSPVHEVWHFRFRGGIGAPCSTSAQCFSGTCADGVCCDSSCGNGAADCQVCSVDAGALRDGVCTLLGSMTMCRASRGDCDPAERCSGTSVTCPLDQRADAGSVCRSTVGPCDVAEQCDGVNATCAPDRLEAAATPCRPPSCTLGVATLAGSCSGFSSECSVLQTLSCTPFVCGGTACTVNCATNSDCASGFFCEVPVCVALKQDGATCREDSECQSSRCVVGACCRDGGCGREDAGTDGGAVADGGTPDAGSFDAGAQDSGVTPADAGMTNEPEAPRSCGCGSAGAAAGQFALMAWFALRRRRAAVLTKMCACRP